MALEAGIELSPALQAAQERLYRLRQAHMANRQASERPLAEIPDTTPSSQNVPVKSHCMGGETPPAHLGWESTPLTAAMREAEVRQAAKLVRQQPSDLTWLEDLVQQGQERKTKPAESCTPLPQTIKLYPDIALGMLKQEKSAPGRIWLLLKAIDRSGQGWVEVSQARAWLAGQDSPLRVCGWRQLRNLLTQGEPIFWQRQGDRLWLRSPAKVAAALDVWHLSNRPVALPVSLLTQGIGTVRAHFYASYHSGRSVKRRSGRILSKPISRATIKQLCRISRRSQRKYEKVAGVRRQHNYAVGPKARTANTQEAAWHRGQALFQLRDEKGKLGAQETTYLAWQLPNNYFGPHDQQPRGQQKRINQQLADLSMQGMTGNGQRTVGQPLVGHSDRQHVRRFFDSGRQAAKVYNLSANHDVYWSHSQSDSSNRSRIWHCLSAKVP